MKRSALLLSRSAALFAALAFAACDGGSVEPPLEQEPDPAAGTFVGLLNGEPYEAPSEYWAESGHISLSFRRHDPRSYYLQELSIGQLAAGVKEGMAFELRDGSASPTPVINTAFATELDGDALIEFYRLTESEPHGLVVTAVDNDANQFRARFYGTFVGDRPGTSEFDQWPDTLRFTDGEFVSALRPVEE